MKEKNNFQNNQAGRVTVWMLIKGVVLFGVMYWLLLPWLGEPSFLSDLSIPSTSQQESSTELVLEENKDTSMRKVRIGENIYEIEVVSTPEAIQRGLGGRVEIGSDGMMFDLGGEQIATFWMKDMLIAIDMIWIHEGKIVSYTPDVQPPEAGALDTELQTYESGQLVDMVLEVPAGFTEQEGFEAGMDVVFVDLQ